MIEQHKLQKDKQARETIRQFHAATKRPDHQEKKNLASPSPTSTSTSTSSTSPDRS
jgi:hypothetical protein